MRSFITKKFKTLWYSNLRGDSGIIYIVLIMAIIIALSGYMVGGIPKLKRPPDDVAQYTISDKITPPKSNTSAVQLREIASTEKEREKVPNPNTNNTPTPTGQPTATPTPVKCSNIAVDFLVDESGSMLLGGKMNLVKDVLQEYINALPNNALVAIQSFAEPPQAATEEVAFTKLSQITKGQINGAIDAKLNPEPDWATYMRDGFNLAKSKLANKESGYKYYLVLISDGVPEVDVCSQGNPKNGCGNPDRNYDLGQDPTYTQLGQPNVPAQIKSGDVEIYSLGIYNQDDLGVNSELKTLLQNIASPGKYYEAQNPGQIKNSLNSLLRNICG